MQCLKDNTRSGISGPADAGPFPSALKMEITLLIRLEWHADTNSYEKAALSLLSLSFDILYACTILQAHDALVQ